MPFAFVVPLVPDPATVVTVLVDKASLRIR